MNIKEKWMREALIEAKKAMDEDEVPVGAVIVRNGEIIARAHNEKERKFSPIAHAEIIAIERACHHLKTNYLSDCELYVTFEPCLMCTGAIINSRIKKVVYGASDLRFASLESVLCQIDPKMINHTPLCMGGILEEECSDLIKKYFISKRKNT